MSNPAMEQALATLNERIGKASEPTDWFEITQDRVNGFADATLDQQWIHVDPERAKTGPFGGPIAHGQLTLSIMTFLPGGSAAPQLTQLAPQLPLRHSSFPLLSAFLL